MSLDRAAPDDPRRFPSADAAPPECRRLHELAEASLSAETAQGADQCDAELAGGLDALLRPECGPALAALFASAPSAAVYRHLWRLLAKRERAGVPDLSQPVRIVAMPIVIVAASETAEAASGVLPGVLDDVAAIDTPMREHGALAGNRTLAFANTLVGADALDFARLPELLAWRALDAAAARALPPLPIDVGGAPRVHLRFLVGTALAASGADLFREGGDR